MRKSFLVNIVLVMIISVLVAMTLIQVYFYYDGKNRLLVKLDQNSETNLKIISDYIVLPLYDLEVEQVVKIIQTELQKSIIKGLYVQNEEEVFAIIKDETGSIVDFKEDRDRFEQLAEQAFRTLEQDLVILDEDSNKKVKIGVLKVYVDGRDYEQQLSGLFQDKIMESVTLALIVIIILVITVSINVKMAIRKVTDEIRKTTGGVIEGNLDVSLDQDNVQREFIDLVQNFNNLVDAFKTPMRMAMGVIEKLARKDLGARMSGEFQGEIEEFKNNINLAMDSLADTLENVTVTVGNVKGGSNELSNSAQSLASGTTEQAASLEEISSTMGEIASQANANNDNAFQAQQLSNKMLETVQTGNTQMEAMLGSMNEISETSNKVSKVIKVIDEIASQTNLLALNAAVEAARAGKYGKGFAVVADEVRSLAGRSAEAARDTTELIETSIKEVENGVAKADRTAIMLKEIFENINKNNDLVCEINSASQEQSKGIEEINNGLTQVNSIVQQNSSIAEETASASQQLSVQAIQMQNLMDAFKLSSVKREVQNAEIAGPEKQPRLDAIRLNQQKNRIEDSNRMITLDDEEFGKLRRLESAS
ncbi:MAG: methyl-accepting chemotaxis protein [Proteobacteria bacterium]|nr:methyl-accepting chemotaxis protein [Pseudomonadota bacterium]